MADTAKLYISTFELPSVPQVHVATVGLLSKLHSKLATTVALHEEAVAVGIELHLFEGEDKPQTRAAFLAPSVWRLSVAAAQRFYKHAPKSNILPVVPTWRNMLISFQSHDQVHCPASNSGTRRLMSPPSSSYGSGGVAASKVTRRSGDTNRGSKRKAQIEEMEGGGPAEGAAGKIGEEGEPATEAEDTPRRAAAFAAPLPGPYAQGSEPATATSTGSGDTRESYGENASRNTGKAPVLPDSGIRREGAQAGDKTGAALPGERGATLSTEESRTETAKAGSKFSAVAEEQPASGIVRSGSDAVHVAPLPGADENAGSSATVGKLVAAYTTQVPLVEQEAILTAEPQQTAESLSFSVEEEVARRFFLPLKRMVYAYLCALRTLMACRLEKLPLGYPSIRLLQEEQQLLQRRALTQRGLLYPVTSAMRRCEHGSGSSSTPLLTSTIPTSTGQPAPASDDVGLFSYKSVWRNRAACGRCPASKEGGSPCTASYREPFTWHIANTLGAESLDQLQPYVDIFEPCIQAAVSPADLSPQACVLLSGALRHLENSRFPGSTHRCRMKDEEHCATFVSVVTAKPPHAGCIAPPTARAIDAASHAAVFQDERETMSSRDNQVNSACDDRPQAVYSTASTIRNTTAEHLLILSSEEGSVSLKASNPCRCMALAWGEEQQPSNLTADVHAAGVAADEQKGHCNSVRDRSAAEEDLRMQTDTRARATVHDFPTTGDGSWCYRDSSWRKPDFAVLHHSKGIGKLGSTARGGQEWKECVSTSAFHTGHQNHTFLYKNTAEEKCRHTVKPLGKQSFTPAPANAVCKGRKRSYEDFPIPIDSAFFRFEGIDDPLLAEALYRAKRICLEHLHWLRQLVPSWSGKAYQEHTKAILGMSSVSELANYLIIFSHLQPDTRNELPVTAASLKECLEELQILQSGYACSALPGRGFLPRRTTSLTSRRSLRENIYRSARGDRYTSPTTVSNASLFSTTSREDLNTSSSTVSPPYAARCSVGSNWSSPTSVLTDDRICPLISEEEIVDGLLSYRGVHGKMAASDTHVCDTAAATVGASQRLGTDATRCNKTRRTNSGSSLTLSAATQYTELLSCRDHTDRDHWRLYEKEVRAALQRVQAEGDSWLLQSPYAGCVSGAARGNCRDVTCHCSSVQHYVDGEKHDSCVTSQGRRDYCTQAADAVYLGRPYGNHQMEEKGCGKRTSARSTSGEEAQNGEAEEFGSTGDDAKSEAVEEKSHGRARQKSIPGHRSAECGCYYLRNPTGRLTAARALSVVDASGSGEVSDVTSSEASGAEAGVPRKRRPSGTSPPAQLQLFLDDYAGSHDSVGHMGNNRNLQNSEETFCSSSGAIRNVVEESAAESSLVLSSTGRVLPPQRRDTKEGMITLTSGPERQNDYLVELLLFLEESHLPCPLQEQVYAEILQYVSQPVVSAAQWKQVVWQEAQQRQQGEELLLHRQRQSREVEPPLEQGPQSSHGERGTTGKHRMEKRYALREVIAGKDYNASNGGRLATCKRQSRRRRKRKSVTSRSSRARRLATARPVVMAYARSRGERQHPQGTGESVKGGAFLLNTHAKPLRWRLQREVRTEENLHVGGSFA